MGLFFGRLSEKVFTIEVGKLFGGDAEGCYPAEEIFCLILEENLSAHLHYVAHGVRHNKEAYAPTVSYTHMTLPTT